MSHSTRSEARQRAPIRDDSKSQYGDVNTTRAALLLIGAALVGIALEATGPVYQTGSILQLTVAIAVIAVAVFGTANDHLPKWAERAALCAVAVMIVWQIIDGVSAKDLYFLGRRGALFPSRWLLLPVVVWFAMTLSHNVKLRRVGIGLVVASVIAMGAWIFHGPTPTIDVLVFQEKSATALGHLNNPYDPEVVQYPDVYKGNGGFYDESLTDGLTLNFGYPYPITSLLAVTGTRAVLGDVRWSLVLSLAGCVLLMFGLATNSKSRCIATLGVAVLLTSPKGLHVLQFGWIEPLVLLGIVMVFYTALRRPPLLPYALGALLTTKQYTPLILPLVLLLVPWAAVRRRQFVLPVIAGAAIAAVPALLLTGYWYSVAVIQFVQPFRYDSLSYAAWWANSGNSPPGALFSFVPPLIVLGLCLVKAPRNVRGFSASCGLVLLVFFAFAKQAFANYHMLAIGVLCAAAIVAVADQVETVNAAN